MKPRLSRRNDDGPGRDVIQRNEHCLSLSCQYTLEQSGKLLMSYISGRFSTGYRATIGADFITKTLPHYSNPDESVTLQIWDTAGQERFSSLSAAFFRGADAAVLMFDVNQPESLRALDRWWAEFCERAPLPDEEMEDYCCVVVGNKMDLADPVAGPAVKEEDALDFIDVLVPPSSRPESPDLPYACPESLIIPPTPVEESSDSSSRPNFRETIPVGLAPPPTTSIDIDSRHHRRFSKSRSRSSHFRFIHGNGTMTTTHTTMTSYHTPSSSYFDVFESARSSPVPRSASPSRSRSRSTSPADSSGRTPRRMISTSTISTSSAPTITPSLFTRNPAAPQTPPTPPQEPFISALPPTPERRPKLFYTSAKDGRGASQMYFNMSRAES
ncbi:hypothetical protein EVG20_g1348 [Dentipellis fragilis]|uniref:Ras-domain-containing protein n=1 Tax=Dentipellis fragilis TaxID=205917 RepID=A0A4Y9ZD21_9AGAM|nr:hypothetical protein EVG20_g1348 [Dentipellis fragilis]